MRVLGIAPSPTELKWGLVQGERAQPEALYLPSNTQKLPVDACEGHALLSLRRLLVTFLQEQRVSQVVVLEAGNSKFGGPSAARVKAEGIIQLAGAELDIPVRLVAPQSLRAQEKSFESTTGGMPESVLNGNVQFKSKVLRDAMLAAWMGLDK